MGVANAAIWFGASIFFTFNVGPAIFSNVQAAPTVPESYVSRSEVSLGPIQLMRLF